MIEHKGRFIALLTAINSLVLFGITMYLPALPSIAIKLHASIYLCQVSLALYFLGYGLSQLFYGPWSDRIGRLPVIYIGLAIFLVGALLSSIAHSAAMLIFGRLVQGLGGGAISVVPKAMVRDAFEKDELAKVMSVTFMIVFCVPFISPIIGSYLFDHFGWRSMFVVMAVYAAVMIVLTKLLLVETRDPTLDQAMPLRKAMDNYREILTNTQFIGFIIAVVAAFAVEMAYNTAGPFLYQDLMGLSAKQYAFLSIYTVLAFVLGTRLVHHFHAKVGTQRMIGMGMGCMVFGALAVIMMGLTGQSVLRLLIPIMICSLGTGLTLPVALMGALQPFPESAGAASAMAGCLQMMASFGVSMLIAQLPEHNQFPLGWTLLGLSGMGLLLFKCSHSYFKPMTVR